MPHASASVLVLAVLLAACGDASDVTIDAPPAEPPAVETVDAPATDLEDADESEAETAQAEAAPSSSARTTAQCRERALEVASWGAGSAVSDHTFAFSSPRDPGACFIPISYVGAGVQSEDGQPLYPYTLQVDEGGEIRDLDMDPVPGPGARIAAVAAEDVNGDGTEDLFVAHSGGEASLAFLSDNGGWSQAVIDNGDAGIFADTVSEVIEFWKNPSFPP